MMACMALLALTQQATVELAWQTHIVHWAYLDLQYVALVDGMGTRHAPRYEVTEAGRIVFDDVPHGPAALSVEDPAFRPLHIDLTLPTAKLPTLWLEGSSTLTLAVSAKDSDTTTLEHHAELLLELDSFPAARSPYCAEHVAAGLMGGHAFRFPLTAGRAAPERRLADSVPPGNYILRVSSPGYADHFAPFELRAGENEARQITLTRGVVLTGTIQDAEGEPIAAELHAFAAGDERRAPLGRYCGSGRDLAFQRFKMQANGRERAVTQTAEDGRFEIGPLEPGRYVLRARGGRFGAHEGFSPTVEVAGEPLEPIVLQLSPDVIAHPFPELRDEAREEEPR